MPTIALPSAKAIPAELVGLRQWVRWKYATDESSSKTTKKPLCLNGTLASSTDPKTWKTFEQVSKAGGNGHFDGVGFVFTEADDYAGIDLDECLNEDGSVKDWAKPILARFSGTYAEISPSGRGIKIWCRGKLATGKNIEFYIDSVKCGVEAYSWGRFFTCTGRRWQNAPLAITPHQADIATALEI